MNGQFDIGGVTPGRYFFSVAIVLGLLFAMISTDQEYPMVLVFIQWQLQTVVPMALLIAAHILLLNSHWFAMLNPWLALAISGVIGASLFAPIALLIDIWLEAQPVTVFTDEILDEWTSVVPPVAICWLALNAPWMLGYRLEKSAAQNAQASQPVDEVDAMADSQPAFMMLVPPEKRGRLLMLKSELHYLQVVTDKGNALILHNLVDAIDQLPADQGITVHRSYWVALDAIEKLDKQGRQGELSLHDGQRIPVSRNRMAEVSRRLQRER